jgi:hypothetical protein
MQRWIEVSEKFSRVTDKLGTPIDDGIFDTVVALNILGFVTSMSCEGHLDHGLPYPWVDVTNKKDDLFLHLSKFYERRVVGFDSIITIDASGRISSQGGVYLYLPPENMRQTRMKEYQDEMREFTSFLKSICLATEKDE